MILKSQAARDFENESARTMGIVAPQSYNRMFSAREKEREREGEESLLESHYNKDDDFLSR